MSRRWQSAWFSAWFWIINYDYETTLSIWSNPKWIFLFRNPNESELHTSINSYHVNLAIVDHLDLNALDLDEIHFFLASVVKTYKGNCTLHLHVVTIKMVMQASNLAAATGRRCPACWPLCPQNILKSTASSGLPSTPDYST